MQRRLEGLGGVLGQLLPIMKKIERFRTGTKMKNQQLGKKAKIARVDLFFGFL